jgi:hypothetical protein
VKTWFGLGYCFLPGCILRIYMLFSGAIIKSNYSRVTTRSGACPVFQASELCPGGGIFLML